LAKIVCDTSPIQYLYQLELLRILPALSECVTIPPAVVREISVGKAAGVNLPDVERFDWLEIHQPDSLLALPLVTAVRAPVERLRQNSQSAISKMKLETE
jgi:predicted nucleic acid-binding protein